MRLIRIRPRDDGDLAACVAVLRAVHERDGYPSNWPDDPAAWLTPAGDTAAWVALDDGEVVGHIALARADADTLEVARLFTLPVRRGTGAGRALLDVAVQQAVGDGCRLVLEVDAEGGAVSFYEHQGWTRTGRSRASWRRQDGTRPTVVHFEWSAP